MASAVVTTEGPLEIYRRMQDALLQGSGEGATLLPADLLADDIVVEIPFAPAGSTRFDGRAAWLAYYRTHGAGLLVRFDAIRDLFVHHTDDPDTIVVEYEVSGTVAATGVRSSVTCIAVLQVRDGRIVRWREYQDLAAITRALTAEPDAQAPAST